MPLKDMLLCALVVAMMAVLAQLTIPLGPVPFTMSVFGVYLAAGILGGRLAAWAMAVYVLLGAFGAPVFTGAKGGFPVVFGPTGGFLWGFIAAAYLIGCLYPREEAGKKGYAKIGGAFLAGLLLIYTLGVLQLKFVMALTLKEAFALGVAPFILPDLLKVVIAVPVVVQVRKALKKAGVLPDR